MSNKEPGYVYILTNPSFREDWVKIGKSSRKNNQQNEKGFNMSNKQEIRYDSKSADSIVDFGKLLLGHSLRELHPEAKMFKGKGGLGNSVEYYHYEDKNFPSF